MVLIKLFWENICLILSAAALNQAFKLEIGTFLLLFFGLYAIQNGVEIVWFRIAIKILIPIVSLGICIWLTGFTSVATLITILAVVLMLVQLILALLLSKRDKIRDAEISKRESENK